MFEKESVWYKPALSFLLNIGMMNTIKEKLKVLWSNKILRRGVLVALFAGLASLGYELSPEARGLIELAVELLFATQ